MEAKNSHILNHYQLAGFGVELDRRVLYFVLTNGKDSDKNGKSPHPETLELLLKGRI